MTGQRSLADSLQWAGQGTELFARALAGVPVGELGAATDLPGWSRTHVVGHVAANASALRNLVTWARTGIETPMYSSSDQRAADIEAAASAQEEWLREQFTKTAAQLADDLDALTPAQWQTQIRTAQGRTVTAEEIPWMRSREVMIHAVDLGSGVVMTDLPEGFLLELIAEVVAKRSNGGDNPHVTVVADHHSWSIAGDGEDVVVGGSVADIAAYVIGRPWRALEVEASHISQPPVLPAWL